MVQRARAVVPGIAHHVTQRGNRRQATATFLGSEDYATYLALRGEWCGRCGVEIWTEDWREYLMEPLEAEQEERWSRNEWTGRPLGEAMFLDRIERVLGRPVQPAQSRPKLRQQETN